MRKPARVEPVEIRSMVDRLVRQAHEIAPVGLREHVHQQRRVVHAARHRARARPMYGGSIGIRPRLGFNANSPQWVAGRRTEPPMSVPTCSGP